MRTVFIVSMRYDSGSEPQLKILPSYEAALLVAGDFWSQSDLAFDVARPDPFYVEPDDDVDICRDDNGNIRAVRHCGGDGCCIDITALEVDWL